MLFQILDQFWSVLVKVLTKTIPFVYYLEICQHRQHEFHLVSHFRLFVSH